MIGSRSVAAGGVDLDVWTGGDGPNLLFLHPASGLSDHEPFLERLSRSFRVTAPAHPGFDGSGNLPTFTTVGDLAYVYLDLIETLDLKAPVIVGASLGAWLAAEIAVRSKPVYSRLVLIGPLGAKFGSERERGITDLFAYPIYEQNRFLFSDPARADRTYKDADQADLVQMARNFETFARLGWSPTLYNPKLRQRLHRLTKPTLVLRGAADQVLSDD